jgi:enamine deaminase RidA (YjgF/YER057c/UK114 family)
MHFSQAVKVNNMIWVSGQVGINDQFETGKGIEEQTRMAFSNLKHVLEEAGSSLADIVELVTYHINMNEMQQFSKVKAEFIPADYPAWTAVGVNELVLPGLLIEIRATAVINL